MHFEKSVWLLLRRKQESENHANLGKKLRKVASPKAKKIGENVSNVRAAEYNPIPNFQKKILKMTC